jgi:uncharacterized membrane-anchored protein
MNDHPQRERLVRELHARPFMALDAPLHLVHLVALHEAGERPGAARDHLAGLCARHRVEQPSPTDNHFAITLGAMQLKWESHAEFASWTLSRAAPGEQPFAGPALEGLDDAWLGTLPGAMLVAIRVHVLAPDDTPLPGERLAGCFDPNTLCAMRLAEGRAEVWADFQPDADGFLRLLVHDRDGDARQLGRRVQRLLEMETYRSMALLALPVAQALTPRVSRIEQRLVECTRRLAMLRDLEAEQAMLAELMELSAQCEEIAASNAYRFGASRAYFEIVGERLARLAESRLGELPTIGAFLRRRLVPAMRTCESLVARHEALAGRITRAANLLRTRVDLAMEAQNRDLLRSMERRARLQLRLQQTVEGLSVAAITYYLVGLVGYLGKAAASAGVALDPHLATGAAVPVVALVVWLGLRRFRRRIEQDDEAQPPTTSTRTEPS